MARKTEAEKFNRRAGPARVAEYMAANPGVSEAQAKKFLRGHGHTPEHGKASVHVYADRDLYEVRSGQRAKSILVAATRGDADVMVEVFDKNNPERPAVYVAPHWGERIPAKWLLYDKSNPNRVDGAANLKKWLEGQYVGSVAGESHHKSPGYTPEGITRIRITVFSAMRANAPERPPKQLRAG